MADYADAMANPPQMSDEQQKQVGQAAAGDMDDAHTNFLKTITGMLDAGQIDTNHPETFLNQEVYNSLDPNMKAKADLAMVNIANLLVHIESFYRSKATPDSAPQLAQMIEELWQMKKRVEQYGDVFKF